MSLGHEDSVPVTTGPLNVRAGAGNDRVFGGSDEDFLEGGDGDDRLAGYAADDTLLAGDGDDLVIAGAGDDYVDLGSGSNKAWGEGGDDALLGGDGDDLLIGDSDSTPPANQGNDYLDGGGGDDELIGNGGNDELFGGDGKDELAGDGGDDYLDGEDGNDALAGGSGADTLLAGAGDDLLEGADGNDYLDGEDGEDILLAGAGEDTLFGGDGHDTLDGDAGNDILDGEDGDDVIAGGEGDDTLHGGGGNDELTGGNGDDTYIVSAGSGRDAISDALGSNTLRIEHALDVRVTQSGADDLLLRFGTGDSVVIEHGFATASIATFHIAGETLSHRELMDRYSDGPVMLDGDLILAGSGAQPLPEHITLRGGGHADVLEAGALSAIGLEGGAGDDVLRGGAGADLLDGGQDEDTLIGQGGADMLAGGGGNDRYQFDIGDGEDAVVDSSGINTISFGAGILSSSVTALVAGDAEGNVFLAVQYAPQDSVRLLQAGTNLADFVFQFADGMEWTTQDVMEELLPAPLDLSAGSTGTALLGSRFDDHLSGGAGNDVLEGGSGSDTLAGGDGSDVYRFQRDDGIDTVTDVLGSTTIEFGDGISPIDISGEFLADAEGNIFFDLRYAVGNHVRIAEIGTNLVDYGFRFADGTLWATEDLMQAILADPVQASAGSAGGALFGSRFDDALAGGAGDDVLQGAAGNDILAGRGGNDSLSGSGGDDTYLFGLGDGVDRIRDLSGSNTLEFGAGITREMLALSLGSLQIHVGDGGDAVHLETFDPGTPETGADVQTFRFADGSTMSLEDLLASGLVAAQPFIFEQGMGEKVVARRAWISEIRVAPPFLTEEIRYSRDGKALIISADTSESLRIEDWFANHSVARPDVLIETRDTMISAASITAAALQLHGSSASDTLSGLDGFGDPLFGEGGDDRVSGLSGDDQLFGGDGNDILDGGGGSDYLSGDAGQNFFAGGPGDDFVDAASSAGGVLAFRAGDGADQVAGLAGTLSIGGNVSPHELVLSRDADDFVLGLNADDSLRLLGWFADGAAPNAVNLQVFGGDGVRTYDLTLLAARFRVMQQEDPEVMQWTPGAAMEQALVGVSEDQAFGGDLAYQYATKGNADALTEEQIHAVLGDTAFGRAAQSFVLAPSNRAPRLTRSMENQAAREDSPFSVAIGELFADEDGDPLVYAATLEGGAALPSWLSFDRDAGVLAGTPLQSDVGVITLRVTATDSGGISASDVFAVSIANANDAPVVSLPLASRTFEAETPFAFTVPLETFEDGDPGDSLSLSARLFNGNPLPSWLSFNAISRTFVGDPQASNIGISHIAVQAIDAGGEAAVADFGLIVHAPAGAAVTGGASDDVLYGSSGNETLKAKGGDDYLYGDAGDDLLRGGGGSDVLQGGDGDDTLRGGTGQNILEGGAGDDVIYGGQGSGFLAGGVGNDVLRVGQGNDVIAFNLGDGIDTVYGGRDGGNTLSLGGGLGYDDLSFSKDGKDLIVNVGAADRVVLKNWYSGNKSVLNLQLIDAAMAEFDADSTDPLYKKSQTFDFLGLVSSFDEARVASPGVTSWALTNALLQWHLSHSDDATIGGDLAYWYGKNGGLSGISIQAAQEVIGASGFGSDAQALRPFAGLQEGFSKLV